MMERDGWRTGSEPREAGAPESVWDYPRPPRLEASRRRVRVVVGGVTIADSIRAIRVLETSHPPGWYIPAVDVRMDLLRPTARRTVCEYKGLAMYFTIRLGDVERREAAWSYPAPSAGYEAIAGHISFYPGRVDEAWLDDERVTPQAGDFYGGWITSDVAGPFKGGPDTTGW